MSENREAYCSACLELTVHDLTRQNLIGRDEYRCQSCGEPTNKCRYCENMARGKPDRLPERFLQKVRASWADELCAEHNGTVASFEAAGAQLADLADYERLFERKRTNLKRVSQVAGMTLGGAAVFGPLSLVAAPSIAGALGSTGLLGAAGTGTAISSLSGAALVNSSLAALGGSMGMSGGVAFLTAAGAALGAQQGAAVSNAYFGSIKGFEIKKLRDGEGPGLLFIDGFLTQGTETLQPWLIGSQRRYPGNPLYAVSWESKRLASVGSLAASGAGSLGTAATLRAFARRALSTASVPVGHLAALSQVVKNPWHVAMAKAAMTGILLADLIARTDHPEGFVLMGHSLGARVSYYALEALGTRAAPCIRDAYLFGGAVGVGEADDWDLAEQSVSGRIFNCYSNNDHILRKLYKTANAGVSSPIGLGPIKSNTEKVVNIDVSDLVSGHTQYKPVLRAVLERTIET